MISELIFSSGLWSRGEFYLFWVCTDLFVYEASVDTIYQMFQHIWIISLDVSVFTVQFVLRFHVFDWGRCPVNMRTFLSVCLLWIRKIKLNGTYFSVLNSPENYDRFVWGLCGMSPSGHYWDYYPGSFSSLSSHCNSFEDRVPVDSSMGTQSSNELQWLYLTHLPLVPHICVIELGHHLFR